MRFADYGILRDSKHFANFAGRKPVAPKLPKPVNQFVIPLHRGWFLYILLLRLGECLYRV
jgi:hypothetical protein